MSDLKRYTTQNVYEAACERIDFCLNDFDKVCLSFSGGKDSSVMLHLTGDRARIAGKKFSVLFIDWEAQYKLTIQHVMDLKNEYADVIENFYWVCLPMMTVNAVSQIEPEWVAWQPGKEWVRQPPECAITDESFFPFYKHAMTFEEFIEDFADWFADGKQSCSMVGIRTDESLNRFRAITKGNSFKGRKWINYKHTTSFNAYPIYDWKTEDIWRYYGKIGKRSNGLYDMMHKAGIPLSKMRICEPYGNEQRKGLALYHIIEPETWGRLCARVQGANSGALYSVETGNFLGNQRITKPDGHTWESFCKFLLDTMPQKTADHYRDKFAIYLKWHFDRSIDIPDEQDGDTGTKDVPSWRRLCKVLLKQDYWCKALSFSVQKASNYENYKKLMQHRRREWGIWG